MQVLIVDDEKTARYGMEKALGKGYKTLEASNLTEARQILREKEVELVLLDLNLGGESGFDLLRELKKRGRPPLAIIITAHGSEKIAVQALKEGAFDYLAKPFELDELRLIARNAREHLELSRENVRLKSELATARGYGELVGKSPAMERVYSLIEKVADTDVTVLLTGESGSGKELVAREIHRRSPRSNKTFVVVNCAAIPSELIESELFGHEKGAFTGATDRRIGKIEQAHGGTLFLDEIGDMPLDTQAKLLRALEEKSIIRLGSNQPVDVDVRIVSATNRDLRKMVQEETFRDDLYYRLEVVRIHIPPLRRREEDIPLLIHYFMEGFSQKHNRGIKEIEPAAMRLLLQYNYPGNVRQLRNMVERLVVLADSETLTADELPPEIRSYDPASGVSLLASGMGRLLQLPFKEARKAFESHYLMTLLREHDNNITHTASTIGIHRQSLQQKIKDLKLKQYME